MRAIAESDQGVLWIGTTRGLDSFDNKTFTNHPFPPFCMNFVEEMVGWNKVRVLLPSHDNGVWVGIARGLVNIKGDRIGFYYLDNELKDVTCLLGTGSGGLWIGTAGKGLSYIAQTQRPSWDSAAKLPPIPGEPPKRATNLYPDIVTIRLTAKDGLSSDVIYSIYRDGEGVLWVGTERGLNRIDFLDPGKPTLSEIGRTDANLQPEARIFAFTAEQGAIEESVNSVVEDDFSNLWLGTGHGIYRFRKHELNELASGRSTALHSLLLDESDGMLSANTSGEHSSPAACKTRDGRLWFATEKGVAIIDPGNAEANDVAPPVVIEEVLADNEVAFGADPNDSDYLRRKARGERSRGLERRTDEHSRGLGSGSLRLEPGRGRVMEFHFTGISFIAAEKLRFQYRMEGYDEEWQDCGTRRIAFYTNLSPGEYRFHVRACNHHGEWNVEGAAIRFSIAPFYYQTWWFKIGSSTAGAIALGGLVGWRLREVHRIHRLEQENALHWQRLEMARDIHDELGASLTRIASLTQNGARVADGAEVEPRINAISSLAREAVNQVSEITWVNNPEYDTLEDLVGYLREYAANYFAASSIELTLEFPKELPDRGITSAFRRHLLFSLKEALTNILKHANAKTVHVGLTVNAETLALTIKDSGCGFEKKATARGNGLHHLQDRAQALGGTLIIESSAAKGTTLCFRIPLPKPSGADPNAI